MRMRFNPRRVQTITKISSQPKNPRRSSNPKRKKNRKKSITTRMRKTARNLRKMAKSNVNVMKNSSQPRKNNQPKMKKSTIVKRTKTQKIRNALIPRSSRPKMTSKAVLRMTIMKKDNRGLTMRNNPPKVKISTAIMRMVKSSPPKDPRNSLQKARNNQLKAKRSACDTMMKMARKVKRKNSNLEMITVKSSLQKATRDVIVHPKRRIRKANSKKARIIVALKRTPKIQPLQAKRKMDAIMKMRSRL